MKNSNDMNNEWVDIIGFEGTYKLRFDGIVHSLDRKVKGNGKDGFQTLKGRVIKTSMNVTGYPAIMLWKDGKSRRVTIHRLVATHFIDNPGNKPQINHKDGNKMNFSIENLEWCTAKENSRHAVDTGLLVNPRGEKAHSYGIRGAMHSWYGKTGELCPNSKLILDTETGIYYHGVGEAAKAKNVNRGTLSGWLTGRYANRTPLIYV